MDAKATSRAGELAPLVRCEGRLVASQALHLRRERPWLRSLSDLATIAAVVGVRLNSHQLDAWPVDSGPLPNSAGAR